MKGTNEINTIEGVSHSSDGALIVERRTNIPMFLTIVFLYIAMASTFGFGFYVHQGIVLGSIAALAFLTFGFFQVRSYLSPKTTIFDFKKRKVTFVDIFGKSKNMTLSKINSNAYSDTSRIKHALISKLIINIAHKETVIRDLSSRLGDHKNKKDFDAVAQYINGRITSGKTID